MVLDNSQSQEVDLDRTDRLPILDGTLIDSDVEDDAVRLDFSPVMPSVKSEFPRSVGVDLPSLAESVRSVEERIARQNAEYEALSKSFEKTRDAEAAAVSKAQALATELTALRVALEAEQARAREVDKTLVEKNAAAEVARARIEEMLRDAERFHKESSTLRDTLVARDAAIVQALHSLGERDAQLNALQREHAKAIPALDERSRAATQLQTELRDARAGSEALAIDLKRTQKSVAALAERLKQGEAELASTRLELSGLKTQAASYLEHLQSREWRRGFDQNMFREFDAKIGAVQQDRGVVQAERDQLRQRLLDAEAKLAGRDQTIGELKADALQGETLRGERERELQQAQRARAELLDQIAALQSERDRLDGELARRDEAVAKALAAGTAAEQARAELAERVEQLREEARNRDEEMAVLVAHLQEARRPLAPIEAEVKRLTDELAVKAVAVDQLNLDNRTLRAALERARGALEEREFLIRRLERSETNNANVLGRIQTSIERLGSPAGGTANVAPVECAAELIRVDGDRNTAHTLTRRTRIGRAPGCEMQIESSSVSRHHALVLMSSRDVIIEDLNSTNGVLVNGRKISRQLLNDGDLLTIGEAQFRLSVKLAPRVLEAPAPLATPAAVAATLEGPGSTGEP